MKYFTFHMIDGSSVRAYGVYTYDEDNFYVTHQNVARTTFPRDRVLYWKEDLRR